MKDLPYFRWYPADAESDDKYSAMTDEELGFFHRCLNKAWINGSIPSDSEERARVLRTPKDEADRLWIRAGRGWKQLYYDESRMVHPRQEIERKEAIRLSKKRAIAGSIGGKRTAKSKQLLEQSSTDAAIRAYGSVYVSESESASGDFEEKFLAAFSRHKKNRGTESQQLVAQMLLSVDWETFNRTHIPFCEYWDRHDWTKCPVTMLEWWRNGMPGPPPETKNGTAKHSWKDDIE